MQGIVYTILSDMVIDNHGMAFWNRTLEDLSLPSKGAYTAGVQYDDEELFQIVDYLAKKLEVTQHEVVKSYGIHLFPKLLDKMPIGSIELSSIKRFLFQVDEVIHKEVKRINPEVYLPEFDYIDLAPNLLVMNYRSKRKLCSLCEGLILGAGSYFDTAVEIKHPVCMHNGADHCRLEIHMG